MDRAITLHIIKHHGVHTPRRPALQSYLDSPRGGQEHYSIDTNGFIAAFADLMHQQLSVEEANDLLLAHSEQQCRNAHNQNCIFAFYPPTELAP